MIGAVPTVGAVRDPAEAFAEQAQRFELATRAALPPIRSYALFLGSMLRTVERNRSALAAMLGVQEQEMLLSLYQQNKAWQERAITWGRAIAALDSGAAELQPWVAPGQPIRFAVVRRGGEVGWWPVALTVIRVAGAVLTGAAVWLADGWNETQKLQAEAELLRAKTLAGLAPLAKNNPAIGEAVANALAEAEKQPADWADKLLKLGGGAGAALGGSALLVFAVLWALGRGKR